MQTGTNETSRVIEPVGRWWLDEGAESGVWPCDVLDVNVFGVKVRPTHPGSAFAGQELWVELARVQDSKFNRPRIAVAA